MLRYVFGGLAAAIAVFAAVAAMQPDDFRYTRSATMNAPPEKIFAEVNDLHKWQAWSPWAKLDPNARNEFTGPDAGTGAVMIWEGNHEVGSGKMTIVESRSPEFIKFQLDFMKPMQGTHMAEFAFKPEGNLTVVHWTMYGKADFIGKAMSLLMNCEKMMGEQFDKGLASLKTIVETPAVTPVEAPAPTPAETPAAAPTETPAPTQTP
jgi:hypothetical protein